MKTEVSEGEYKGNKLFVINEIDDDGKPKQYPIISMGKKKAKAILKHIEELKEFVGEE